MRLNLHLNYLQNSFGLESTAVFDVDDKQRI